MVGKRGTARTYRCPDDHKHGATGTCFNTHGCGCFPCVEGRRVYQLNRDKLIAYGRWEPSRTVDALGVRRRLQALAYMGWPSRLVAEAVGTRDSHIRMLADSATCRVDVRDRVFAAYELLWDKEPPGGRRAYTANMARRKGWAGPLHWDDIDDPEETPTVRTVRNEAGWALDELEHLRLLNVSATEALASLPQTPASLERQATRHDRNELAAWIRTARNAA